MSETIYIDDLVSIINAGIYGDDRMSTVTLNAAIEALTQLVARMQQMQAERDHFRNAWAAAQARLDCGTDATEAVRYECALVVAWLRRMEKNAIYWSGKQDNERADIYHRLADVFECGEHREEQKES